MDNHSENPQSKEKGKVERYATKRKNSGPKLED